MGATDPPTSGGATAAAAGRVRRWGLRLAAVLVGLLAAEVVVRGALAVRGRAYSAAGARERIEARRLALEGGVARDEDAPLDEPTGNIIHPYVGWWSIDLKERVEREYGEGAAALRRSNAPGYHIWLLGGSVAVNFGRKDAGRRPFLERVVADSRFDGVVENVRRLQMHNFAHAAHKQPQQVALVSFLLALGLVPDAIINLDGFNEVAVASSNVHLGTHPVYPAIAQWGVLARNPLGLPGRFEDLVDVWLARRRSLELGAFLLDSGLYHSACLGSVGLELLERRGARWNEVRREFSRTAANGHKDPVLRGPPVSDEHAQDAMIRAWSEGSVALESLCEGLGIPYLHVLQPTLHDAGAKPWTPEERRVSKCSDEWLEGVRFGYPRMREEGGRLRRERGIAFFDASMVFRDVEETLYFDACHFNDRGNRILAVAMADAFLELFGSDE